MDGPLNPFDDDAGEFHVLRNAEEQHSLWPTFAEVPSGWEVVLEAVTRDRALDYVRENWPDIRPLSVRRRLGEGR